MKIKLLIIGLLAAGLSTPALACLEVPIPGTTITENFGMRYSVKRGWHPHKGSDMRAAMGTPVRAAIDGVIVRAGFDPGGAAGNRIVLQGADGTTVKYFHLSKYTRTKTNVVAGEIIGESGNSGIVDREKPEVHYVPHLHFEVLEPPNKHVDPRTKLCSSLPEKAGAGPAREGIDGSTAPNNNPISNTNIPAPDFTDFEDRSDMDVMSSETGKRFLNPDWHAVMNGCGNDAASERIDQKEYNGMSCDTYIANEQLNIRALKTWIKYKTYIAKESTAMLMSTKLLDSIKNNDIASEKLGSAREKAFSENARN